MRRAALPALALALVSLIFGSSPCLAARTLKTPEYYFKAGFLANFARLVDWPDRAFGGKRDPVILCVIDPAPFGDALAAVDGKRVRDRSLSVKICGDAPDAGVCHILFANSPDRVLRKKYIDAVRGKPVLVVGESSGFAMDEGMINFYSLDDKIRFEINRRRSRDAGLRISSRLLKLGRIVDPGTED